MFQRKSKEFWGRIHSGPRVIFLTEVGNTTLQDLVALPTLTSPKEAVCYMLQVQQRQFGKTIVDSLDWTVLHTNMKRLWKKYSPDDICRAIYHVSCYSNQPFSTLAIRRVLEWTTHQRSLWDKLFLNLE